MHLEGTNGDQFNAVVVSTDGVTTFPMQVTDSIIPEDWTLDMDYTGPADPGTGYVLLIQLFYFNTLLESTTVSVD